MNSVEGNVGVLYGKRFGLEMVRDIRTVGTEWGGRVREQKQTVKVSPATLRPDV